MLHLYRRENTVSRKDKLPADAGDGQTGARGSKNHTSDALDGQQKTDDLLSESDLPAAGRLSSTQPAPLRQLAFQEDVTLRTARDIMKQASAMLSSTSGRKTR